MRGDNRIIPNQVRLGKIGPRASDDGRREGAFLHSDSVRIRDSGTQDISTQGHKV